MIDTVIRAALGIGLAMTLAATMLAGDVLAGSILSLAIVVFYVGIGLIDKKGES